MRCRDSIAAAALWGRAVGRLRRPPCRGGRSGIKAGLDGAYWNFPDPQGPNTDVTCFQFAADTIDRTFTYTMMAGGVNPRTMSGDERPTALYARIGSGTPPTELIDPVDSQRIPIIHGGTDDYPFDSHDGLQWDVLRHTDTNSGALTVPAGATCLLPEGVGCDEPTQPRWREHAGDRDGRRA